TDVENLVAAGPFVPTLHQPGERIVMERNEYFGEWNVDAQGNALPYLDALNFALVTDGDAALNLYRAGEIDTFSPRNLDDISVILSAINNGEIDADLFEDISPQDSSEFIVFNWNLESD